MWIDTHCHLDAPELGPEHAQAIVFSQQARAAGVALCVIPVVQAQDFEGTRRLAHQLSQAYALGIHPLRTPQAQEADLTQLKAQLKQHASDARLVAVGEIGLDFFVEGLDPLKQETFYREQLKIAREFELPVIVHVRRSADRLLKYLREVGGVQARWQGIAHAFNGSIQQAEQFIELGLKLGFGGAMTFERATHLQELARSLPLDAMVMETDTPDIPPTWLYKTAAERQTGEAQSLNSPAQLPRIGAFMADLRGISVEELARVTTQNALQALPKLQGLLPAKN